MSFDIVIAFCWESLAVTSVIFMHRKLVSASKQFTLFK